MNLGIFFQIFIYPEKYLPACMELVLNAPFHLDSLGRPVLDVTRTVNHLGGHHDHMMTSCWDDIMIIWYHIQRTFFYVYHTFGPPVMIIKKMISWWDDMMTLTAKLLPSLLGPKEFLCLWRAVNVKLAMIMWMIKHIGNNLKVVFTHTWPCWGNPVTQDWHCQPEKGKCQHLIQDHLIFYL